MNPLKCQLQPADGATPDLAKVSASLQRLLEAEHLCSIASVSEANRAHINTAFFAADDHLRLFFLFEPDSRHARFFKSNPSAAVAIYSSTQPWGSALCGMQLFGEIKPVDATSVLHGYTTYASRFLKFKDWISQPMELLSGACATRLMVLEPANLTLFDEPTFGKDSLLNFSVKV